MYRRTLAVSAVGIVVALALGGCSPGVADGGDGKVVINMVESLTNPTRTVLLKEQIADFQKANPSITVKMISPPTDSGDQKIQTMLQSKTGIDVFEVGQITVAGYAKNGWIRDISSDLELWDGWKDVTQSAKDAVIQDGKYYYVPYGSYATALFYRTDLAEQAGFSGPPDSWSDLIEQAKAINDPAQNRYGFSMRGGTNAGVEMTQMIEAYNADDIDRANAFLLKDGNTIFSTAEAVKAMEDRFDLYKNGSPPSSIGWGYPEMVQGFSSGLTAQVMQTQEVIATVEQATAITTDKWATAPIPVGPTGKAPLIVSPSGWGVAQSSAHPVEALKLVQYLTSGEQILRFDKENGQVPAVKSAGEDPFFKEGKWAAYVEMNDNPEKYPVVTEPRNVAWFAEWQAKSNKESQEFLLGKISPAELMASWDKYWTEKRGK